MALMNSKSMGETKIYKICSNLKLAQGKTMKQYKIYYFKNLDNDKIYFWVVCFKVSKSK
jgi:hypothetical protein